jgi:D-serine dehydratase
VNEPIMPPSALNSTVAPLTKGLGYLKAPLSSEQIAQLGWNLLREDLSLPAAVLYEDRLQHNLDWMRQFVGAYGVKLAPHGKTTMAPKLFHLQLKAGAWGISLATAQQTLVAYEHGVRRVLMANQLVGKANMAMVARLIQDPDFEYYCLVDSAEQVDQLGSYFSNSGCRLNVLLEIGVMGGRTGIRDDDQLAAVLEAVARWNGVVGLCGVELYEGVLDDEIAIRAFLLRAVDTVRRLAKEGRFDRAPILLSGAGSAWFDVVADVFCEAGFGDEVEIVLRPGCYLTHDAGLYRKPQERILRTNPIARKIGSGLLPALQVWAYVQSMPEAGRAIIGMGKRDASFDAGLPMPILHFRPGGTGPTPAPADWTLTKMMDQHAFMQIAAGADLRVGDMIGFDISHPCLTFDKWRVLPVLDARYQVIDIVETFF